MSSALAELPLRSSIPQRLLLASALAYTAVFGLVVAYGRPGLGVSQGFYLAVVLAALATDAPTGAAAGAVALVLYEAAELVAGRRGWDAWLQPATGIRLLSYVLAGVTVGWFATRARGMLAESLHVLDDLLVLARRDPATGLRSKEGFEERVTHRIGLGRPFAVLLAGVPATGWTGRHASAGDPARLLAVLGLESEVVQLGADRYAAIVNAWTPDEARAACDRLERELAARGREVSAGWALHPSDGSGGFALVSAAVERLQERRLVRGEWAPTPESIGLVTPLQRS